MFEFLPLISAGASLLGGMMGGDDPVQQPTNIQGFAALPKQVQDMWLNQYLRDTQNLYNQGNQTPPMVRARTGRYDSQGLKELQAYADNLTRMQNTPEAIAQRQAQQAAQAQNQSIDPAREAQLRRTYANTFQNDVGNKAQKFPDLSPLNAGTFDYKDIYSNPNYDQNWNNWKDYQDWRSGFGGNQQTAPQASQMGNAMAGNPVMGGQNAQMGANPMGNIAQAGMQGNAAGMDSSGSRSLFGSGYNMENGVRSLPGIEPFNPMQESAFDQIQNFQPNSIASYANPYATGALNQLQGLSQFNPTNKPLQDYMNPYQDQVINRTLSRMGEELQGGENTILGNASKFGGLGAFGSGALGNMLANRQNESLKRAQDFVAQQNQANFGQAQDQRNLEIGRQTGYLNNLVSGGNDTFRIAGGLQAVGNDQRRQSLQDLLAAGNQVQQQGQNEINAVNPLMAQQMPQNKLNQLGQNLSMIPNSGQSFQYQQGQPNMLTQLGNAGMGFAGLHQGYQNERGTPWLGALSGGIGGLSSGRIGSLGGYL